MTPGASRSFSRLGVRSVEDLLWYLPRWHCRPEDLGRLGRAASGRRLLVGMVVRAEASFKGGRHLLRVTLRDDSGSAMWTWFNRPFLARVFRPGQIVALQGAVEWTPWGLQVAGETGAYEFLAPRDWERVRRGGVLPVYHATPNLSQEEIRALVASALDRYGRTVPDPFPPSLLKEGLLPLSEALRAVHLAPSWAAVVEARRRIGFQEAWLWQLQLLRRRAALRRLAKPRRYRVEGALLSSFRAALPFTLTGAQERAVRDILADLAGPAPMNRLLQGDVGSGKTVVAAHAMVAAAGSGLQSAVMAPTEILAAQHARTLGAWLEPLGVRVGFLAGTMGARARAPLLEGVRSGAVPVVVGTHALLEETVVFHRLGLVVMDERHKFGVRQRLALSQKGDGPSAEPDSLMMTATPFPRSLVLTLYGDTDVTVLDEMPPGRLPVATEWVPASRRREAYQAAHTEVGAGGQVFMVYPTIEEGPSELRAAAQMAEELQQKWFPDLRVGLVHGRLPAPEREAQLAAFRERRLDVLVATTVIEVGLDISGATMMVVEHAERFGLAQLHQLRGRVGRGSAPSRCLLVTGARVSGEAEERLKVLEGTQDGFQVAEADLRLRGPGELLGVAQHGVQAGRTGRDDMLWQALGTPELLTAARGAAEAVLAGDPELQKPEHGEVRRVLDREGDRHLELLHAS